MKVADVIGKTVLDANGEKVGVLSGLYSDDDTDQPKWATVTTGLFGLSASFVPLSLVSSQGEDFVIDADKDQVKNAPNIEPDEQLTAEEEEKLYKYYLGVNDKAASSTTDQADGGHDDGDEGRDDAMTRSEEEVHVGKEVRESGKVRLKKFVVTENVNVTIPLRREKARLVTEPVTEDNIDRAMAGPDISEGTHEVVLHEEVPIVDKQVVPKERIKLAKDVVNESQQVNEQVRKEQIEVDGDDVKTA